MASLDKAAITNILAHGLYRQEVGRKQLKLAFGNIYIASTTLFAKPALVWENDKSYPRYYVPTESLHPDIKSRLDESISDTSTTGHKVPVNVENIEAMKGEGNHVQAIIERLTVGPRSTTWVRFIEGPLKGFVRFERSEIDDWFEDGALFSGITNPYKRIDTVPVSHHIVIRVDGQKIAETNVAVLLNETGLKETYYLPATSIADWGSVEKSVHRTECPYKGEAWYLSITVKGKKYENLIWYYPYPTHESAGVAGFISFYNKEGVDILVDEVKI